MRTGVMRLMFSALTMMLLGCGGQTALVIDESNGYDGAVRLTTRRVILPTEGGSGRNIRAWVTSYGHEDAPWAGEMFVMFGAPTARNIYWVLEGCATVQLWGDDFEFEAVGTSRWRSQLGTGTRRDFEWLQLPMMHVNKVAAFIESPNGGGRVCDFEFELTEEYREAVRELIRWSETGGDPDRLNKDI